MLRADNAYMRQRLNEETMLDASLETVQPRTHLNQRENNEESFGVTQRRLPEISGIVVGTPLPDNWKSLTMEKYDGSTDPDEHVAIYTTQISLYTWNDAILCNSERRSFKLVYPVTTIIYYLF